MSPEIEEGEYELGNESDKVRFDIGDFIERNKVTLFLGLIGLCLVGFGVILIKNGAIPKSDDLEILETPTESETIVSKVVVDISGAVTNPGVYSFESDARIEDLLIAAGGVTETADLEWLEKSLNRAAKLIDGQKIFIPRIGESVAGVNNFAQLSESGGGVTSGAININSASQKELESLSGIGPVYAQNIIEHRPYSFIEELVSKGAIKQSLFEKIQDSISVY